MTRRGTKLILLLACVVAAACNADRPPPAPDLPVSVSPGWTRQSFGRAALPSGVPTSAVPTRVMPECWKADYASGSAGSAQAWVCGYASGGSAFDALQRTAAAANTVKLQEGNRLAVVKWSGVSREEIKALVLAIQRSIH